MAEDSDSDLLILDQSDTSPFIAGTFEDFVDLEKEQASPARCWSIAFYRPYFQVDSQTVLRRLKKALMLSRGYLFEGSQPDLYGPFWVITTLIFVLAFTGNAGSYLESSGEWAADINKVVTAYTLLSSTAAVLPLVTYVLLSHSGSKVKYMELLSVYCYSFAIFIPSSCLCILPDHLVRLAVTCFATGVSLKLLHSHFWVEMEVLEHSKYLYGAVACVGHLALGLLSVFFFFE
jgi:hypothetical protein